MVEADVFMVEKEARTSVCCSSKNKDRRHLFGTSDGAFLFGGQKEGAGFSPPSSDAGPDNNAIVESPLEEPPKDITMTTSNQDAHAMSTFSARAHPELRRAFAQHEDEDVLEPNPLHQKGTRELNVWRPLNQFMPGMRSARMVQRRWGRTVMAVTRSSQAVHRLAQLYQKFPKKFNLLSHRDEGCIV